MNTPVLSTVRDGSLDETYLAYYAEFHDLDLAQSGRLSYAGQTSTRLGYRDMLLRAAAEGDDGDEVLIYGMRRGECRWERVAIGRIV